MPTEASPSKRDPSMENNRKLFPVFNQKMKSMNLKTYEATSNKFSMWLSDAKAYYQEARPHIVEILETAHTTLCATLGNPADPFTTAKMTPQYEAWWVSYVKMLKVAGQHLAAFVEPELLHRLGTLLANAGIQPSVQAEYIRKSLTAHPSPPGPEASVSSTRAPPPTPPHLNLVTPDNTPQPRRTSFVPGASPLINSPSANFVPEVKSIPTSLVPSASLPATPVVPQNPPSTSTSVPVTATPAPKKKKRKKTNLANFMQVDLEWYTANKKGAGVDTADITAVATEKAGSPANTNLASAAAAEASKAAVPPIVDQTIVESPGFVEAISDLADKPLDILPIKDVPPREAQHAFETITDEQAIELPLIDSTDIRDTRPSEEPAQETMHEILDEKLVPSSTFPEEIKEELHREPDNMDVDVVVPVPSTNPFSHQVTEMPLAVEVNQTLNDQTSPCEHVLLGSPAPPDTEPMVVDNQVQESAAHKFDSQQTQQSSRPISPSPVVEESEVSAILDAAAPLEIDPPAIEPVQQTSDILGTVLPTMIQEPDVPIPSALKVTDNSEYDLFAKSNRRGSSSDLEHSPAKRKLEYGQEDALPALRPSESISSVLPAVNPAELTVRDLITSAERLPDGPSPTLQRDSDSASPEPPEGTMNHVSDLRPHKRQKRDSEVPLVNVHLASTLSSVTPRSVSSASDMVLESDIDEASLSVAVEDALPTHMEPSPSEPAELPSTGPTQPSSPAPAERMISHQHLELPVWTSIAKEPSEESSERDELMEDGDTPAVSQTVALPIVSEHVFAETGTNVTVVENNVPSHPTDPLINTELDSNQMETDASDDKDLGGVNNGASTETVTSSTVPSPAAVTTSVVQENESPASSVPDGNVILTRPRAATPVISQLTMASQPDSAPLIDQIPTAEPIITSPTVIPTTSIPDSEVPPPVEEPKPQAPDTSSPSSFSAAQTQTLAVSRGSPTPTTDSLSFYMSSDQVARIAKWRNRDDDYAYDAEVDSDASCLSLACYRAQDAFPLIEADGAEPFDKILSKSEVTIMPSWPRSAHGWFTVNDTKASAVHMPPFLRSADDFVDISAHVRPGKNTIEIHHLSADLDMSEYVFAVFLHTPSVAECARVKAQRNEIAEWNELLDMISKVGEYPKFDWTTGTMAIAV